MSRARDPRRVRAAVARAACALRRRLRGDAGYTLVELLVAVAVIGVLAAIALPAFAGKKKQGDDVAAKSDARNLVSRVELCYTVEADYTHCDTPAELGNDLGLSYGTGPGQVAIVEATELSFTVRGVSRATSGGANHTFTIQKDATYTRGCTAGSDPDTQGGCRDGSW